MFKLITNTLILAILLFTFSVNAQPNFSGQAYDIDSKELVYTEHHTFSQPEQTKETDQNRTMQSSYLNPQGVEIASRQVIYAEQQVKYYQLIQSSIGYSEAITRSNDQITIDVQKNTNTDQQSNKTKSIKNAGDIIIDAGFSDFILRNWNDLLSGKTCKFKFSSTSRMGAVGLQVRLKETTQDSVLFSMTASNPVVRMLLTPILIGYSSETKHLTHYKGISNIRNNNGDTYNVEIFYQVDKS